MSAPALVTPRPQPITPRELVAQSAILLVAIGAAYRHSLAVPFQFDDLQAIVDNPAVHLGQLTVAGLLRALESTRPLSNLSFALNFWLTGPEPLGFHVVNLAIHAVNALLVYLFARKVLGRASSASPHGIASLASLMFLLHPVHTQAVTYVVQRMTSLGATFALASAVLWFGAFGARRSWAWHLAALVCWLLACGCKQNYVTLPLVLLGAEALLANDRAGPRRWLVWVAGGAIPALVVAGFLIFSVRDALSAEYARMGLGPLETLVEQPRVLVHYLSLLAAPLPTRLRVDRFWELSRTIFEWRALAATVALSVLVTAAFASRGRAPLVAFAALWFFGNLLVEQTVLPIDLYFEHRLYLPSVGLLLLAAAGLASLAKLARLPLLALALPLLAWWGLVTDARNELWRSPLALNEQALEGGSGTPRSWNTVGVAKLDAGDLVGAEAAFRQALSRSRKDGTALTNLGQVAERQEDTAGAERWYRQAIGDEPALRQPRVALVLLLSRSGRFEEARAVLTPWLTAQPREPHARYAEGVLLGHQGQPEGAIAAFSTAIDLDPGFAAALRDRGAIALHLGRWPEAVSDFSRVAELLPRSAQSWRELGYALERAGDRPRAIAAYERALELTPDLRLAEYVAGLRAR